MKVTANGSGLKYQWYVSKDSGKTWNSLGNDFARASVSFEATEARNGYSYRCVVTDGNGKSVTSSIATLKIGPMGHGSKFHRHAGSNGACSDPGRVFKGKKMPGQMGSVKVTIQNLEVVKVDAGKCQYTE